MTIANEKVTKLGSCDYSKALNEKVAKLESCDYSKAGACSCKQVHVLSSKCSSNHIFLLALTYTDKKCYIFCPLKGL